MSETPFLDCYVMQDPPPALVPGRSQREWMDAFAARQPYRCLPMTMANATGWEIQCPFDFTLEWNGGPGAEDITITSSTSGAHVEGFVISHFRSGIVTFHTGYMFRTPPGWALWCMGPPNEPKDAAIFGDQREHVSGRYDIILAAVRVDGRLDRQSAITCTDARRDAFAGLN